MYDQAKQEYRHHSRHDTEWVDEKPLECISGTIASRSPFSGQEARPKNLRGKLETDTRKKKEGDPLLIPAPDNSNASSRHVPEANMEASELATDDEEHTKWLRRVFDLGQELWGEAEGQCDLGRLVEVRLEDRPEFCARVRSVSVRGQTKIRNATC